MVESNTNTNVLELEHLKGWKSYKDESFKEKVLEVLSKKHHQIFVYRDMHGKTLYMKIFLVKEGTYRPKDYKDINMLSIISSFEVTDNFVRSSNNKLIKGLQSFLKF